MAILGIDWGQKRIGLALSEQEKIARPLLLIRDKNKKTIFCLIQNLCNQYKIKKIIIGIPQKKSFQNQKTQSIGKELAKFLKLPVYFFDEDFSSRQVNQIIKSKKSLDAESASLILQNYLDQKE